MYTLYTIKYITLDCRIYTMKKQPKKTSFETDLQKAIRESVRLAAEVVKFADEQLRLIKQLDKKTEAERVIKKVGITEKCSVCDNSPTCSLLSLCYEDRKKVCLILRCPIEYSGKLIIPESHLIWKRRLNDFISRHQQ